MEQKKALITALLKTLLTYVFTITPLIETIGIIFKQRRDRNEHIFLNKKVDTLINYYKKESAWMSLPNKQDDVPIPMIVAADWTHCSKEDNAELQIIKNKFVLKRHIGELTGHNLKEYRRFLKEIGRRPPRDDENLRIVALQKHDSRMTIVLQPVKYFDTIKTNFTMDFTARGKYSSLRCLVHKDQTLEPLGHTSLSDHIGVDTLLFSVEGNLIISERGRNLAVTPGRLGPAGAGALKLDDFPESEHSVSLHRLNLFRELIEETAITRSALNENSLRILGIGQGCSVLFTLSGMRWGDLGLGR
ncbi:MAG: hypothetical protein U1E43_01220 [Rhodospirillales bacterium]